MDGDIRVVDGGDAFRLLDAGDAPLLIVADHASNRVPADIDLGVAPGLLDDHIALDIGVFELAGLLAHAERGRAILGRVSRLVIDLNREEDAPGLIPIVSDGIEIPGNAGVDREARLDRFHRPYHAEVARQIDRLDRPFIVSLHSFTPRLRTRPDLERPWDIGILYNEDRRAAAVALDWLEGRALNGRPLVVGDQLPYSGRDLNHSMNRHAEARGLPYLGIEIRQDVIGEFIHGTSFGLLAAMIEICASALA